MNAESMLAFDAIDPDISMQAKKRAINPNKMYLCANMEINLRIHCIHSTSLLAEGDSQSPKRIELDGEDIFYYAKIKR